MEYIYPTFERGRIMKKESLWALRDYIKYVAQIELDEKPPQGGREIELCRFKLREGSMLRTEYKDFYDIQTEFDTVNLADAGWGSRGGITLSMEVTDAYARKILECDGADPVDIQFAYLALQGREAVNRDMLVDYLRRRGGKDADSDKWTNSDMFVGLESILQAVRSGKDIRSRQKTGRADRMIILD